MVKRIIIQRLKTFEELNCVKNATTNCFPRCLSKALFNALQRLLKTTVLPVAKFGVLKRPTDVAFNSKRLWYPLQLDQRRAAYCFENCIHRLTISWAKIFRYKIFWKLLNSYVEIKKKDPPSIQKKKNVSRRYKTRFLKHDFWNAKRCAFAGVF